MKAPTVSPLADGGFAIETVVEKRGVNRLIPLLQGRRRHGHPGDADLQDRALRGLCGTSTAPRGGTLRPQPPVGKGHVVRRLSPSLSSAPPSRCLLAASPRPPRPTPATSTSSSTATGEQTAFTHGATGYAVAIDKQRPRSWWPGYTLTAKTDIALARFLPNGKPDPDFGGGDGRVDHEPGRHRLRLRRRDPGRRQDRRGRRARPDEQQPVRRGALRHPRGRSDKSFSERRQGLRRLRASSTRARTPWRSARRARSSLGGFTSNGIDQPVGHGAVPAERHARRGLRRRRQGDHRHEPHGRADRGPGHRSRAGRSSRPGYAETSLTPRFAVGAVPARAGRSTPRSATTA